MTARRTGNFMAMINTLNRRILGVIFLLALTKGFPLTSSCGHLLFLFEPTPPDWRSVFSRRSCHAGASQPLSGAAGIRASGAAACGRGCRCVCVMLLFRARRGGMGKCRARHSQRCEQCLRLAGGPGAAAALAAASGLFSSWEMKAKKSCSSAETKLKT